MLLAVVPVAVAVSGPVSEPTDTIVPGRMHLGKFVGNADSVPVGLLDKTNVPAPVPSVVMVPIRQLPIMTFSVVPAAAPVTVTENVVVVTPLVVVLVKPTTAVPLDALVSVAVNETFGACPAVPDGGGHGAGGGGGGGVCVVAAAKVPLNEPTEIVVAAVIASPLGSAT